MTEDRKPFADVDDADDEIEILEVVGIDEDDDDSPVALEERPGFDDDDEALEIEVDFAEGDPQALAAEEAAAGEEELRARLTRLHAEFDNFKKRTEREKDDFYKRAVSALVARLLPVIDNFERAVASAPAAGEGSALHEGIALIHRQLLDELKREGLQPIESVGYPFDPELHEAVATETSDRHPANTVIEELQRGYLFLDRLLRPAAVRVNLPAPGEPETAVGEEG